MSHKDTRTFVVQKSWKPTKFLALAWMQEAFPRATAIRFKKSFSKINWEFEVELPVKDGVVQSGDG